MQKNSAAYILGFCAAVCVVCSLLVSAAAVTLRDRQVENALLDKQKNVLSAIGMLKPDRSYSRQEIAQLFSKVEPRIVNLQTGEYAPDLDPQTYNQNKAVRDPEMSRAVPPNSAQIMRLPLYGEIYEVVQNGKPAMVVLPIRGKGLWSTMYGFLALGADGNTIKGITFYQHGETPGLGGEVDNPAWKSLWPGRKVFAEDGEVAIALKKGRAGSPAEDPYQVDGLSGATITSRGVNGMLQVWLGEHGYGPYLEKFTGQAE